MLLFQLTKNKRISVSQTKVCDIWMKNMTNHPLLIGITEFRWENTRSFHARLVIENSDLDLNSSLLLQDISHFQDSWDYYSSNSATYQKEFSPCNSIVWFYVQINVNQHNIHDKYIHTKNTQVIRRRNVVSLLKFTQFMWRKSQNFSAYHLKIFREREHVIFLFWFSRVDSILNV